MKILIIGNGGREHALAWKIAQSPKATHVFVAPGNAGTALESKVKNVDISATDISALTQFAIDNHIDLTIVGPEAPLALGIVDHFQKNNLKCFGPTQKAAQLESSKAFCKDFMHRHQIPTAQYANFTELNAALEYVRNQPMPIVIKASGLAAGKGVVIANTLDEAESTIHDMLQTHTFGDAGNTIVIEEFLEGEELSYIVMVDGNTILPLASSQDHKRLLDHDEGPNTGGMGAYSPSPLLDESLNQKILEQVIQPTIHAMQKQGSPYTGFLYAGLMIAPSKEINVLEFNCRLGDPETQPILFRLESDLLNLIDLACDGKLDQANVKWNSKIAVGVVMVAGGYPQHYQKGDEIHGLNALHNEEIKVFHAGTKAVNGKILTDGGRVLCVVALGNSVLEAQYNVYQSVNEIHWKNCFYRKDIGWRAL